MSGVQQIPQVPQLPQVPQADTPRARGPLLSSRNVGLAILALIVVGAVIIPWILADRLETRLGDALLGPSLSHPFGTDPVGRDLFARVAEAARTDVTVAVVGVLLSAVIGGMIGVVVGYSRGRWSGLLMRGLDAFQAFPLLVFALLLLAFVGGGVSTLIIAVGFVNIPIFIRLVRAETLAASRLPYVDAATCVGCSTPRILWRHILPNVLTGALTQTTTAAGYAIILVGALGFLGVGTDPGAAEWGVMIQEGVQYMTSGQWWLIAFPGVAIVVTVVALQMVGESVVKARRVR